jgi:hypothetical protein
MLRYRSKSSPEPVAHFVTIVHTHDSFAEFMGSA